MKKTISYISVNKNDNEIWIFIMRDNENKCGRFYTPQENSFNRLIRLLPEQPYETILSFSQFNVRYNI